MNTPTQIVLNMAPDGQLGIQIRGAQSKVEVVGMLALAQMMVVAQPAQEEPKVIGAGSNILPFLPKPPGE